MARARYAAPRTRSTVGRCCAAHGTRPTTGPTRRTGARLRGRVAGGAELGAVSGGQDRRTAAARVDGGVRRGRSRFVARSGGVSLRPPGETYEARPPSTRQLDRSHVGGAGG